ncbi:DUF1120 domain-containing protein [Aeromonas sp. 601027]|uniref:DUF1120 domain-containing protein n=3 Tax=Aeromonas TaxID=642 RepID=UPI003BA0DD6E
MKMKPTFNKAMLACLMMSAGSALAAGPTAELKITGTVSPGACVPTLDAGGIVDFGETSINDLPETGTLKLAAKELNGTLVCTGATKVAISFADNRASSVPTHTDEPTDANTAFGLGTTTDGINIGSYSLAFTAIQGDGIDGDLLSSANKTTWGKMAFNDKLNNQKATQYLSFATSGTSAPTEARAFNFTLKVEPSLSSDLRGITETANLDGNTTINFEYM